MHTVSTVLALLLYATAALAETTYYTRQSDTSRAGRRLSKGSDAHTCSQAQHSHTPKASINSGIACLQAGDTLIIGAGTYKELIIGSYNGNTICSSGDAAVQPGPCAIVPNGRDPDHLTTLRGDGDAVVAPDKALPGGGGIASLYDASRYIRIEGLRFNATGSAGAAAGVHLGNSQYITLHHNEISGGRGRTGALVANSITSRYHTITANNIHHGGEGCDPRVDTSPPCVHCGYFQGQDHWIADNWVHHCANYGLQISAEDSSGIARVTVAMNRVEYNQGVGIRLSGTDNKAFANLLVKNGLGMTASGTGLIANNTLDGIHPETAYSDAFGIWTDGNKVQIVNNIFTNQKSAWYMMQQRTSTGFVPVDPAVVHANGCDLEGNIGCTKVHPTNAWYQDAASGDYALSDTSPARGAGKTGTGVEVDITHYPYASPDLGAYAWRGTPVPPQPEPVPPGGPLVLACVGQVTSVPGNVSLTCTQHVEGRR